MIIEKNFNRHAYIAYIIIPIRPYHRAAPSYPVVTDFAVKNANYFRRCPASQKLIVVTDNDVRGRGS